jgi:hypothetical protein
MSTDRILQQLDRLYCLVEQYNSLLTDLDMDLPHHSTRTPSQTLSSNLKHTSAFFSSTLNRTQLFSNLSPALFNNTLHTSSPRHTSCPPPTAIPTESTPAPRRHPRSEHYLYYAVRVGRTTGIFTNWADCFQSTNGITTFAASIPGTARKTISIYSEQLGSSAQQVNHPSMVRHSNIQSNSLRTMENLLVQRGAETLHSIGPYRSLLPCRARRRLGRTPQKHDPFQTTNSQRHTTRGNHPRPPRNCYARFLHARSYRLRTRNMKLEK